MKKEFLSSLAIFGLATASCVFTSCGDDDPIVPGGGSSDSSTKWKVSVHINTDEENLAWDFETYNGDELLEEMKKNINSIVTSTMNQLGYQYDDFNNNYSVSSDDRAAVEKAIVAAFDSKMNDLKNVSTKLAGTYTYSVNVGTWSADMEQVANGTVTLNTPAFESFEVDGIKYQTLSGSKAGVLPIMSKYTCTYSGDVVIPQTVSNNGKTYKVTAIGPEAFYSSSVTSVKLPEGITTIYMNAFSYAKKMTSLNIPSTVVNYKEAGMTSSLLGKCTSLTDITLAEGLKVLPDDFLHGDVPVESISIPSSLESLPYSAFCSCKKLKEIKMTNGTKEIGKQCFWGTAIENIDFLPASVTVISGSAFYSCDKLTNVNVKEGVTAIDKSAFAKCGALTSVTLPSTVKKIGTSAFANDEKLEAIHFKGTTPPELEQTTANNNTYDAFYNAPETCKLYVPSASLETYKSADVWSSYANRIVGE